MMMVEGGSGSALGVSWLLEIFHFAICFLYHKDVRAFNEYNSNLKYSRTAMPLVHVLKNSNGYRISPSPTQKKQVSWKNVHLANLALLVL